MTCEKDVQKVMMSAIHRDIPARDILIMRNNVGLIRVRESQGGEKYRWGLPPGSSDYIGAYRGMFLAIETKWKHNKVTKKQQDFLNAVNRVNGIGLVINEKNVHKVALMIREAFEFNTSRKGPR